MTEPDVPAVPDRSAPPPGVRPLPARAGGQPAGWYPAYDRPGMERYWDGGRWAGAPRSSVVSQAFPPGLPPGALPPGYGYAGVPGQPVFVQQVNTAPRYVSGISNGERVVHIILTVCTFGLWALIWIPSEWLRRKRIG